MTKEQAIEKVNKIITTKFNNDYSIDNVDKEAIEIILSMLEEKDEIIEQMIYYIMNLDIDEDICKRVNCNTNSGELDCKDCIKQYFENKAKELLNK